MIEPFIKRVCFTAVDITGHQILFSQIFILKRSIFEERDKKALLSGSALRTLCNGWVKPNSNEARSCIEYTEEELKGFTNSKHFFPKKNRLTGS